MEKAIKKAIEGGYKQFNAPRKDYIEVDKALLDPLFWQSLGKAMGWGTWNKNLSDVIHEWELSYYQADSAKTPVYDCKICGARKINNAIYYEVEYEYLPVEGDTSKWIVRKIIDRHGGEKKPDSKHYWHSLIDHLAEGKSAESFFTNLIQ